MSKRYCLGLDQGTTATTALLLDEDWNPVGTGSKEHRQINPRPDWVEHDPMEIWNNIQEVITTALRVAGASPKDLLCIGHDNQGETCMIWDKNSGKPIYNAIVWQDRRTAREADRLAEVAGDLIKEKTGLVADTYFSATKFRWILDNVDGAMDKAKRGELLAGTLDTWVTWKLTGGRVFATDYTTASRTMLFNIHTAAWDDEIIDLIGIPKSMLPEIYDSACLYGHTDPDGFLATEVPITGCMVDQQAALFGQACYKPGGIKTSFGTASATLMNIGDAPIKSTNGLLSSVASGLDGGKLAFTVEATVYIAGAVVQWLRDRMKLINLASDTEGMAISAQNNGGVYFVPAFVGLSAPHWDQYARGTIVGLSVGTTREQLVRAALESIAYSNLDVINAIRADTNLPIEALRVDGGMVRNSFMMQFQADILDIPVEVPSVIDTTALGSAYLAYYGTGECGGLDELAAHWKLQRRFEPRMGKEQRQSLLHDWNRALERSKAWVEK